MTDPRAFLAHGCSGHGLPVPKPMVYQEKTQNVFSFVDPLERKMWWGWSKVPGVRGSEKEIPSHIRYKEEYTEITAESPRRRPPELSDVATDGKGQIHWV